MRQNSNYFFLLAALVMLFPLACQKDFQADPKSNLFEKGGLVNDRGGEEGEGKGQTILGQKRSNPYSVENIRLAYKSLYEINLTSLTANHLYVRFLPQSPEDIGKLLHTDLEFTDFPLDYDIVQMGEYYHDPSIADPNYTWRYVVVPYNFTFPAVQYEILEQLALVPEDSRIAEKAFQLTGNEFETPDVYEANPTLVNDRFNFTPDHGNPTYMADPGGPCTCALPDNVRKPSGCVTVYDNMLGQWDAVMGIKVLTARTRFFGWAFHRTAISSAKGCWYIDHDYYKKIHVWVKYESPASNIKVMQGVVDLWGYTWPYQPYIGKYGGPNFNNISIAFNWSNALDTKEFRNWAAATANNSVYEFRKYCAENALPNPPDNLKILITPWGHENKGSTPMLEKLGITTGAWNVTTASISGGVFGIFGALPSYLLAFPFGAMLTIAAPDIVLNINIADDVNADDLRYLLYHELAHAQHAMQAGPIYWNNNIGYVTDHGGYGQGNFLGAGSCAVIEMWGYQNGYWATHLRYGIKHSNVVGTLDPAITTWQARSERATFWEDYIAFGWQYDLRDNNALTSGLDEGQINNVLIPDAVSGFTQAQIFSTMTPVMYSPHQQRLALQAMLPPGTTLAAYNALANAYGL